MSLIELRGLTHVYSKGTPFEKVAIDNLNLTIERGETVGLIGHTGSSRYIAVHIALDLSRLYSCRSR